MLKNSISKLKVSKESEKPKSKKATITDAAHEEMRRQATAKKNIPSTHQSLQQQASSTSNSNRANDGGIDRIEKIAEENEEVGIDTHVLGPVPIVSEADEDEIRNETESDEDSDQAEEEQFTELSRLKSFEDVRKVLNEKITESENSKSRVSRQLSGPLPSVPAPAVRSFNIKEQSIMEESLNAQIQNKANDQEIDPPFDLKEKDNETESAKTDLSEANSNSITSDAQILNETTSINSNNAEPTSETFNSTADIVNRVSNISEEITEQFKECIIDEIDDQHEDQHEDQHLSYQKPHDDLKKPVIILPPSPEETPLSDDEFCDSQEI